MKIVYLFLFALIGFAPLSQAQTYLTFEEIALEVVEAPTQPKFKIYADQGQMLVQQAMKTQYAVTVGSRSLPVSERRFAILATLFKTRMFFSSPERLSDILRVDQDGDSEIEVSDWDAEIQALNAQFQETFGKHLVLSEVKDGITFYKIASRNIPARDNRQIADFNVVVLGESGDRVQINGRLHNFSRKQGEMIQALFKAPDHRLTIAEVIAKMGLNPKSKMYLRHMEDVNKNFYYFTGRLLIEKEGRNVLHLMVPPPRPLEKVEFQNRILRGQEFKDLSKLDIQLIDLLDLEHTGDPIAVRIPPETTAQLDSSPGRIERAFHGLNLQAVAKFGKPFVGAVTFTFPHPFRVNWTAEKGFSFSSRQMNLECEILLGSDGQ